MTSTSETSKRSPLSWAVLILATGYALFHIYTAYFGVFPVMIQRSLHVTVGLLLAFLYYPARRPRCQAVRRLLDTLFFLGALIGGGYIFVTYQWIRVTPQIIGSIPTYEVVLGIVFIIAILEATRRTLGWGLPIICLASLVYAYAGPNLPGILAHRGYDLTNIIAQMYTYTEGIFSTPVGVTSTYIVLFILFAALLESTGAGEFFIQVANSLFGAIRGGPAKVAVVASALMGTISGSAAANVSTTGSFTIPLMRRIGYRPEFAGGVEAAASSGGQLMPPIMGAAAFLISETLGVPYRAIMAAALIPAALYFFSIFVQVDFEARRLGLRGLNRSELPPFWPLLIRQGIMLLPLIVLVAALTILKVTPMRSGFWAIVTVILLVTIRAAVRRSGRSASLQIMRGLENGARSATPIVCAVASAGLVIGVITLTGLGLRLSSLLTDLARGNLLALLILTAASSIVLGMGLPTVAAYLVLSITTAPALVDLGVDPVAAHLFIFYFGVISGITPPVAIAAFAAAGIAQASPVRVGLQACLLALPGFIIPFLFVYSPVLLLQGAAGEILWSVLTAAVGIGGVGAAVTGFIARPMSRLERICALAGGLLLVDPNPVTDLVGCGLLLIVVISHFWLRLRTAATPTSR